MVLYVRIYSLCLESFFYSTWNFSNILLEVRYYPVSISPPTRLKKENSFSIYAVYAREINIPENCEPVKWMLFLHSSNKLYHTLLFLANAELLCLLTVRKNLNIVR